jgi:hypothetical protein
MRFRERLGGHRKIMSLVVEKCEELRFDARMPTILTRIAPREHGRGGVECPR